MVQSSLYLTGEPSKARRASTVAAILLLAIAGKASAIDRHTVSFSYIREQARRLAERPYSNPGAAMPEFLENLNYDEYWTIRPLQTKALWAEQELPFRITFSFPGYMFTTPTKVHEFTATHVQELPFAPHFFDFGRRADLAARIPPSLGYAGFHVLYPLSEANKYDQLAAFLGSGCFQVAGQDTNFGVSSQPLAIKTTTGDEELAVFREFWLGKPAKDTQTLVIYALLDAPSVTGAYRFELMPGRETVVLVQLTLFFRKKVAHIGLTPLSSMFLFNDNSVHRPLDYRPRVHTSDGLLIRQPDGTDVWRPLINPAAGIVSVYRYKQPVAFGLCQRDRNFANYQDIEQGYERRTSVWFEPGRGDWGAGSVVLQERGTDSEEAQNITACWQPKKIDIRAPYSIEYTLKYSDQERSKYGCATATRVGGPVTRAGVHQYIIDFDGRELRSLEADRLRVVAKASRGIHIENPYVVRNSIAGGWRLTLPFSISDKTVERGRLTAYLAHKGKRVTETWSYLWCKERVFPSTPHLALPPQSQSRLHGMRHTGE